MTACAKASSCMHKRFASVNKSGCALLIFISASCLSLLPAGAYMEPAAAWGRPCEFQLATWSSAEEPSHSAHSWAPAGLPPVVEYAPTDDTFGNSSLQPYSIGQQQQQLALYNYDYGAAAQPQHAAAAAAQEPSDDDAMRVFEHVTHAFEDEAELVKLKMHRCPPAITRAVGEYYTVPRVVAIGPYHRERKQLLTAEKVKHVAAHHCIKQSHRTVREVYDAVVSVADGARDLYDEDARTGISYDDFRHMMFFDACFLVQFMLTRTDAGCDPTLYDFLESNENDILHDIMLLENQIPWRVVEAVMCFTPVPLGEVIAAWRGRLQVRRVVKEETAAAVDLESYDDPPHFLGFIRFHLVGSSNISETDLGDKEKKIKALSTSVSASELAEMGINLTANQTTELAHMGLVNKKAVFFAELSMAPLSLDDTRASWLVNMAALELCTTPDFFDDEAEYEDSATCSYLLLLCMLVHREEDVHQLRTKGILGGAGLTDKEALRFFTNLHSCLRLGCHYAHVMVQIESYRIMRRIRIQVYAFVFKNWKTIVGVGSAIGAFVGILKALKSLKGSHQ